MWAFALRAHAVEPCIAVVYSAERVARLRESGKDDCQAVREAVEANGGRVAVIGQGGAPTELQESLRAADGVVLPGGIDVDPAFYGEERHPKLERTDAALDALEFSVLDYALSNGLPILGICRGHQVLNVYFGGTLYQDIASQIAPASGPVHRVPGVPGRTLTHPVTIAPDSLLYELVRLRRVDVTTRHHQAVKQLGTGLAATAHADDGVIEAIERPGAGFVLGVQFHPESMWKTSAEFNALFERFVEEAKQAYVRREREGRPIPASAEAIGAEPVNP
ncbi:MAG: gamma-glutamyl-gamma-aminobutyrate hydrolase family protein [Candidatus Hydrogenedentes bacterium]|nr:gamma-glutamyl-gamma-aminobutyrate hydrolase family protein [Candidatus Hydrogenedentota bacterium]